MEVRNVRLPDLCRAQGHLQPVICLECFPPREGSWNKIEALVKRSERYRPDFLTMTDTGRARGRGAIEAAIHLQRAFGLPVVAHLACADRTRAEFLNDACALVEGGIRHVLVLRGDPPRGSTFFRPHRDGFCHANEALQALKDGGFPFTMGAAHHPLGHPDDAAPDQDLVNMARKAKAGAAFFVGQILFDETMDGYRRRVTVAAATEVTAPMLPCHLAVATLDRLQKMVERCGAHLPPASLAGLTRRGDHYLLRELAGFARSAWVQGAPGFYLSTLNDAEATAGFLEELFESHVAHRDRP